MNKHYDIIVIGAGIIGLNIAYQIRLRSPLKVLVLEQGAGVGEGSTGASSAVCRFRYSLDEVTLLARDGINAYQHWPEYTRLREPRAAFQNEGVVWIPGSNSSWAPRQKARMDSFGIRTEVFGAEEFTERFPGMNPCSLAPDLETGDEHRCESNGNFFFESDGGYMDPVSTAQDLVDACRLAGVDVRFNCQVSKINTNDSRATGVTLANSDTLHCNTVINATGPWCRPLYSAAGVNLSWDLKPVRIQVVHRDRPPTLEGHIPVTVDMEGGIYFRTQNRGQQLIVSSVMESDEREVVDPDDYLRVPDAEFELKKLHALHHRLPALDYRGHITGYCGLYTVNMNDVHPVLGPTAIEGFWVANGMSGHGFKLAPAIGAMIAKALTGESGPFDTVVPMSFLSYDREPFTLDSKSVLA